MKRTILSAALAASMVLTTVPGSAVAAVLEDASAGAEINLTGTPEQGQKPAAAQEQIFNLSEGSITIHVDANGRQTVTQGAGVAVETQLPVITGEATEQNTLTIQTEAGQTARLTLRDLIMDVRMDETTGESKGGFVTAIELGTSRAEITVEDTVQLQTTGCPAIHVSSGALLLKGNGTLAIETEAGRDDRKQKFSPAAIGSNGAAAGEDMSGTIEITDQLTLSVVNAMGSLVEENEGPGPDDEWGFPTGGFVDSGYVPSGPCIGAGAGGAMSGTIRIMGQAILDLSSDMDACIGGGIENHDMSGSIVISDDAVVMGGATVGAVLGTNGADITESGSITIQDHAKVTAYGSAMDMGISVPGAGIGTGYQIGFEVGDMNGTITIQDDAVVDSESGSGAAIGAGDGGSLGGSIVIRDRAQVTRAASYEEKGGAGIGAGCGGSVTGSITIQDQAQVNAEGCQGAAIGTGYGELGDTVQMSGQITISGSTVVSASNTNDGAAIGTGYCGNLTGGIAIKGQAQVETRNEARGAGIGTGEYGKISGSISITDTARVVTHREYGDAVGIGPGRTGGLLSESQMTIGNDTHIDGLVELKSENAQRKVQVRGTAEIKSGTFHEEVLMEVCPNAVLSVGRGAALDLMAGELVNNGTLNNGGTILLDRNDKDDAARIRDMRLSGEGGLVVIRGQGEETFYDNDGVGLISSQSVLNFTGTDLQNELRVVAADHSATLEQDGYHWEGNTLTISRLRAEGLILPTGMELVLEGVNVLTSPQNDFVALDVRGDDTELTIRAQDGQKGFLNACHKSSGSNLTTNLSNAKTLTLAGNAEISADRLEQTIPGSRVCFRDQSIVRLNKKLETTGAVAVQDRADVRVAVTPGNQWYHYALKADSLQLNGGHFFAESQDSAAVLLLAEQNPLVLENSVTMTQPVRGKVLSTTVNGQKVTSVVPEGYQRLFLDDKILAGDRLSSTNAAGTVEYSSSVEGQYKVCFDANGGTGTMTEQTVPAGNYILPNCGFTAPAGKRFKAWAIGSPEGEQRNAKVTYDLAADITLYAIWENMPLSFTYKPAFDIPGGDVSTAIRPVDISGGAMGGELPYTFEKQSGPDWLEVSPEGILSGTRPATAMEAAEVVILLKDSTKPEANQKTITLAVGEVLADGAATHGTLSAGMQAIRTAQEKQDIFGRSYEPQSYIWMGSYEGQPVVWRVLDDRYDNMGQTGAVFMLSEYGLGSSYLGGVYFDHTGSLSDQWVGSDAQLWCDEFEKNSLTELELSAVRSATKQDWPMQDFGWTNWKASELKNDQVFFLSAGELADYVANHDEWDLVYASRSDRSSCPDYYLRSPMEISGDRLAVGVVNHLAKVNFKELSQDDNAAAAARPALNLNRDQVLFTSAAEGGKAGENGTIKKVAPYDGNEWKLTLLDPSRSGFRAELSEDGTQIIYSGAKTGEHEYISVLVETESGEITHYGRIAPAASADGAVPLDLTGVNMDGKSLYVINEQYNGGKLDDSRLTDYASSPICIKGRGAYTITVNSTEGGTAGADQTTAAEGTTITLHAEAAGGYHFVRWQVTPEQIQITGNTFRMPGSAVMIRAIFELDHANPEGGGAGGGAGGGSGGGSAVTPPKSQTLTKPDGTVIETSTRPDGTKVEIITTPSGDRTVTEINTDGSSVIETRKADGTTAETTIDKNGKTEAEVTLSDKAVKEASEHHTKAELPIPELPAAGEKDKLTTISANMGNAEKVPVVIPVKETKPGTVLVKINEDGTREIVRKSIVLGNSLMAELPGSGEYQIVDNTKTFTDHIPDWAQGAVDFVSSHELIAGTGDGVFSPAMTTSRGMVTTILYRLENNPKSTFKGHFIDVEQDRWYTESIMWAAENGIISGYGNNSFGPDDLVTREQLAVILYRYAGSPDVGGRKAQGPDATAISDWAENAMAWCMDNGLIGGNEKGELNPTGRASRAEFAMILMRFIALMLK